MTTRFLAAIDEYVIKDDIPKLVIKRNDRILLDTFTVPIGRRMEIFHWFKIRDTFFILLLVALTAFAFCSCSSITSEKKAPQVVNGVLDLRNWDLESDGPVPLDGQWHFFWKKLADPTNVSEMTAEATFLKVPISWNGQKIIDTELSGSGFATYHCRVLLPDKRPLLGIKFPTVSSAFDFFVDGKKLSSAGKVGTSKDDMVPEYRPHITVFKAENNTLEIAFQVSNYYGKWGGLWYSLYFGSAEAIIELRERKVSFDLFLFGIYIIMFFYHLALFALRPKEKLPLYFGFLCLAIALRGLVQNEVFLLEIFKGLSYRTVVGLDYGTVPLVTSTASVFVWASFPRDYFRNMLVAYLVPSAIFLVLILFTPPLIYQEILVPYQIVMAINILYICAVLLVALKRKREGAYAVALGFMILALTGLNDALYSMHFVFTLYLVSYGLLTFVFCQAYMLSQRFSKAFSAVEKLSVELEDKNIELIDLNQNLELKVEERTEELVAANGEMSALNEKLVETRDQLWGEMKLAKRIQTVLLPKELNVPGYEISAVMNPADDVGGDYFDVISVSGHNWFVIGDVSGHGVPAGLVMMMVQTSIHTVLEQNPGVDPSELLAIVNKTIFKNIVHLQEDKFMTINVFAVSNGGNLKFSGLHQDLLIYRASSHEVEVVEADGMWIGIMNDIQDFIETLSVRLGQNDVLLLYTDGITEAYLPGEEGKKKEMFGDKNLMNILEKNGHRACNEIQQEILAALQGYIMDDDVTMMVIKRLVDDRSISNS